MILQQLIVVGYCCGLAFSTITTTTTTTETRRNGINWRNRNYSNNPVTIRESNYISLRDDSGISAAVCHRTLFGNISLDPIFAFVSYYRLLGFDHVFFWYRPEVAKLQRFQQLHDLPYVTMTQYDGGGREHGQEIVHHLCLKNDTYAGTYDWALIIDIDEYLWFKKKQSIKSFILEYQLIRNKTYISFGKWMYTVKHSTTTLDSGFGLDEYPYTVAKSYCIFKNDTSKWYAMGASYCPTFQGRAKILIKVTHYPTFYTKFLIHGDPKVVPNSSIHVDLREAHLKEWCHLMSVKNYRAGKSRIIIRNDTRFPVPNEKYVDTHSTMKSHEKEKDGKLYFYFDKNLQEWMTFVAQGCPTLSDNNGEEEARDQRNITVLDTGRRHTEYIGAGFHPKLMLVIQGIEFIFVMSLLLFWYKVRSRFWTIVMRRQ